MLTFAKMKSYFSLVQTGEETTESLILNAKRPQCTDKPHKTKSGRKQLMSVCFEVENLA